MFNLSRRSRYGRPGKKGRQRSSLWYVFWGVAGLISLEIGARIFLTMTGKAIQVEDGQGLPANFVAYRPKFVTSKGQTYDGLPTQGSLKLQQDVGVGYRPQGQQKTKLWQLNDEGFRDQDTLPLAKPKGEIRIFVLGGSVAFGQGLPSNDQTISYFLEQRLQARVKQQRQSPQKYRPDVLPYFKPSRDKLLQLPPKLREGNYRVINVAVPGYTTGNSLAQLALEILPYQPDAIVMVGGYDDMLLPSDQTAATVPDTADFEHNAWGHLLSTWRNRGQQWLRGIYLIQLVRSVTPHREAQIAQQALPTRIAPNSLAAYLPANEKETKARLERFQNQQKNLVRLSGGMGIPLVVAIQPEISGMTPEQMSPSEKDLVKVLGGDRNYIQKVAAIYPDYFRAIKGIEKAYPNSFKALSFYRLNEKFPKPVFNGDPIHLTVGANQEIAEQIYYGLLDLPKMQVIPKNLEI